MPELYVERLSRAPSNGRTVMYYCATKVQRVSDTCKYFEDFFQEKKSKKRLRRELAEALAGLTSAYV